MLTRLFKRGAWVRYSTQIRDELDRWAVWMPGDHVELGAYGVIEDNCFKGDDSLAEEGQFTEADFFPSKVQPAFEIGGLSECQFSPALKLEAPALGQIQWRLDTKSSRGVFLRATNITIARLKPGAIRERLGRLKHGWDERFVIVEQIYSAERFQLVINRDGETELSVGGDVTAVEAFASGALSINASVRVNGPVSVRLIGQSGPLFVGVYRPQMSAGPSYGIAPDALGDEIELEPLLPQSAWVDSV